MYGTANILSIQNLQHNFTDLHYGVSKNKFIVHNPNCCVLFN